MKELEQVAKHHKEWVRIIKQFGEHFYADDLVQETYLMLHKWSTPEKYLTNGQVNKGYVWLCLRNSFLQYQREKKRLQKLPLDTIQELTANEDNKQYFDALEKIDTFIENEVNSWHWYDKMLFDVYRNEKFSMRQISKMTGISLRSIHITLSSCKERVNFAVGEDYQDLINNEFELINDTKSNQRKMKQQQAKIKQIERI